jgi:hypothetical protein
VLVKYILPKNNVTTLQHPPYFPYQAAADFVLFPLPKTAWKERRFCESTDIIKNATEELKRLSQSGFQECLQHLYSRWLKLYLHKGIIIKEI